MDFIIYHLGNLFINCVEIQGYYTSRNKLKGMTREADNTQRVADIAVSLVKGLGALVDQSGVYGKYWLYKNV